MSCCVTKEKEGRRKAAKRACTVRTCSKPTAHAATGAPRSHEVNGKLNAPKAYTYFLAPPPAGPGDAPAAATGATD